MRSMMYEMNFSSLNATKRKILFKEIPEKKVYSFLWFAKFILLFRLHWASVPMFTTKFNLNCLTVLLIMTCICFDCCSGRLKRRRKFNRETLFSGLEHDVAGKKFRSSLFTIFVLEFNCKNKQLSETAESDVVLK